MENYLPPDRLLHLKLGSIISMESEDDELHFKVVLVGIDNNHSVITTLPGLSALPQNASYRSIFHPGRTFELKTIHEGRIVAFESTATGFYQDRLFIGSFPEMIETRQLRRDTRFPCALSCDIRLADKVSYGAITNISNGGCQLTVKAEDSAEPASNSLVGSALESQQPIELEVFFPYADNAVTLTASVKSAEREVDGDWKVGAAFTQDFESVRLYLESLQLDSIAPFFH